MEITFTKRFGDGGKERTKSLHQIVEDESYDSDSDRGALERVRSVADTSIKFTSIVVEILHRRGALNDREIMEIVDRIGSVDDSKPFKITHED